MVKEFFLKNVIIFAPTTNVTTGMSIIHVCMLGIFSLPSPIGTFNPITPILPESALG